MFNSAQLVRSNFSIPRRFEFDSDVCEAASRNETLNFTRYPRVYCFSSEANSKFYEISISKDEDSYVTFVLSDIIASDVLLRNLLKTCINYKYLTNVQQSGFFNSDMANIGTFESLNTLSSKKAQFFSHDGCEHKLEIRNRITSSKSISFYLNNLQLEKCAVCKLRDGAIVVINSPILLKFTCVLCCLCFETLKKHHSDPIEFIEINSLI